LSRSGQTLQGAPRVYPNPGERLEGTILDVFAALPSERHPHGHPLVRYTTDAPIVAGHYAGTGELVKQEVDAGGEVTWAVVHGMAKKALVRIYRQARRTVRRSSAGASRRTTARRPTPDRAGTSRSRGSTRASPSSPETPGPAKRRAPSRRSTSRRRSSASRRPGSARSARSPSRNASRRTRLPSTRRGRGRAGSRPSTWARGSSSRSSSRSARAPTRRPRDGGAYRLGALGQR
jgi:hypothetical protein